MSDFTKGDRVRLSVYGQETMHPPYKNLKATQQARDKRQAGTVISQRDSANGELVYIQWDKLTSRELLSVSFIERMP